jgi:hypothetical protein
MLIPFKSSVRSKRYWKLPHFLTVQDTTLRRIAQTKIDAEAVAKWHGVARESDVNFHLVARDALHGTTAVNGFTFAPSKPYEDAVRYVPCNVRFR